MTTAIALAKQIELWEPTRLVPYLNNARTHSDAQVDKIMASMQEFGFTNPVLVDSKDGIIAGHGRLMAATRLGLPQIPVIVLDHLSDAQRRAYILADNRLALDAGWDDALLAAELEALSDDGFDLSLTGFTDAEIDDLLEGGEGEEEGGTGEDEGAQEPPEQPVSVLGDVWVLGKHRLMCGDSTSVDAFAVLMADSIGQLVFTDHPYGMSYDGGRGKKNFGMIKGDDAEGGDLIGLVRDAVQSAKLSCDETAAMYVCFPWRTYAEFESALESIGVEITSCIVWNKGSVGLGHQEYRPQHEFIFYSKGGEWYGDRSQSDVWTLTRGNTGAYVHPTQKPVELVEIAIQNSSKKNDVVIDCFGGSGSTLIACEKTNRQARLMELDPKYVDVIVKRWQDFSGKTATLESTGETFSDLAAKRLS